MQKGSVNKVILVGHVGVDPEPRYTSSGTAVVNISLATNESVRSSDGENREHTEWHRVVLWGKQAEFVGNYVKKGQLVYIDGRLQTKSWEDRDKVERRTTEVVADTITMLGSSKGGGAAPSDDQSAAPTIDDDDIPF